MSIYLDNAATTKVYEIVIKKNTEILENCYGNPSSLHSLGLLAQKEIDIAREQIASSLCCEQKEIIFTSGGTEANNISILGSVYALKRRGNRIITTAIEHPSVLNTMKYLEEQGFEVIYIMPTNGKIEQNDILNAIDNKTILVSAMLVNNETGELLPIKGIKQELKKISPFALFHCDAVQAYGKVKINVNDLEVDLLTISGHKIHCPKGVGALYIRNGVHIKPITFGGGQENSLRNGTENVSGIAAFGLSSKIKFEKFNEDIEKIFKFYTYFINELKKAFPNAIINSQDTAIPHIINFSLIGYRSEIILHFLESRGIFISSGSACSSKKNSASHVLKAMGLQKKIYDSALRVSFSAFNTIEEIDEFIETLNEGTKTLIKN